MIDSRDRIDWRDREDTEAMLEAGLGVDEGGGVFEDEVVV